MHISHHFTDEEFWAHIAEADAELLASFERAGAFEIADWRGPVSVGEWGFTGGVRSLTFGAVPVASVTVLVENGTTPRDFVAQRRQVRAAIAADGSGLPDGSDLPDDVRVIMVDDVPVVFEIWDEPGLWCAAGQVHEHTIAIESEDELAGDVSLRRVADIQPYVDGRNALIRGARGGVDL